VANFFFGSRPCYSPEIIGKIDQILKGQGLLMSKITDFATQQKADDTASSNKLDSIIIGITQLDAAIVELRKSVSTGGTMSPEDAAALDEVAVSSAALKTKILGIDATMPVGGPDVPPPPPSGPPA
jgi:hypothetical protein